MHIKEEIGTCALLEQTAEECAELAQAALKLARKMRGDNPTPATIYELHNKVTEEIADVRVCMDELLKGNVVSYTEVTAIAETKLSRWQKRIEENKSNKNLR